MAAHLLVVATALLWMGFELRQALRVRPGARKADRGSLNALRVAAGAGALAGIAVARLVPAAALPRSVAVWLGWAVLVCGVTLRVWCFQTLGRYFTITVQTSGDQPVITTGPYRVLRHPAYTGLLLAAAGLGLLTGNWLSAVAVFAGVLVGLVYRIRVEERALLSDLGEEYTRFAATRKRLVPLVW